MLKLVERGPCARGERGGGAGDSSSDAEGGQGKSEVKVPDGRGEKRGVGRKERGVGGERKPGDAVEAAEAKEEVGEISLKLGVIRSA